MSIDLKKTGITEAESAFLAKVVEVRKTCAGHQEIGDSTEFYDEDGVVIMVSREDENGMITFKFTDSDEEVVFEYNQISH